MKLRQQAFNFFHIAMWHNKIIKKTCFFINSAVYILFLYHIQKLGLLLNQLSSNDVIKEFIPLVLIKKKTQLIDTVYIIIFVRTFDLIPSKDIALLHLLGESHGCIFLCILVLILFCSVYKMWLSILFRFSCLICCKILLGNFLGLLNNIGWLLS